MTRAGSARRFRLAIAFAAVLAVTASGGPRLVAGALAEVARAAEAPGLGIPLPAAFPVPAVPAANLFSPAKAELGRYLFYDRRLSGNETISCASCHQQRFAFTDGPSSAVGATGQKHRRSAMSLANVAYNRAFNWADSRTGSLEEQMLVPMLSRQPIELGMAGLENVVLERLARDPEYPGRFAAAFPDDPVPLRFENVVRAIATFERTLISAGSAYDRYVRGGDRRALSEEAERGMELFFSPRLACSQCHSGFNLAGNTGWYGREPAVPAFHDTGVYRSAGNADLPSDTGRFEESGNPSDMGAFRAPTLRNVELSAPYMHDGSVSTLEDVVAHYSAGGRTVKSGPLGGDGRLVGFQSELVRPLGLTATESSDLVAFLRSLTDHEFVSDPRFADPLVAAPGDGYPRQPIPPSPPSPSKPSSASPFTSWRPEQ